MESIEIVDYNEQYHEDFKQLSYEWLEKYVTVEPEDVRILNAPKAVILDNGGYIYFAKYQGEIVGTVSLIKVDAETFELAKLAVTEKYQGLSIGRDLMTHCLSVVKQKQVKKIILYTDNKLVSAVALYRKFSFKEVPMINNKYVDSDLMMALDL
ncbi:GNAT family N-acetyltransferase [Enterococcus saccharolyticus]|uniref:GNAT family N-acetyltransferase n=1 Tax=Enterococcus saccharolyticus TaxID=41997 RepID=UPI001E5CB179|nr:GNAT family N-acetyltransferase [Enterococcus saccharolyticus]MCD5000860.1 GNAT family N-acetyltransferase [Enterococcus saccharolyticus]